MMCIMNYYDCAVLCKNTELNLTLADQGILMGTGSFANNCHLAGCQVMGNSTACVSAIPVLGKVPPASDMAVLIIAVLTMIVLSLMLWYWREKK